MTHVRRLVLVLPLALLAAGCMQPTEPPLYATNFEQVRVGMPRLKVQELLGEPYRADYRKGVVAPRPSAPWRRVPASGRNCCRPSAEAEPAWSERWQYGRFSVSDFGGPVERIGQGVHRVVRSGCGGDCAPQSRWRGRLRLRNQPVPRDRS